MQTATFRSMVQHMDAKVGQMLGRLDELGIADNTIVLFTSDNGAAFEGFIGDLKGGKTDLHDGGTACTDGYQVGDARFTRKVFASHPDETIVMHLDCNQPGKITFELFIESPHVFQSQTPANDTLLLTGQVASRGESKSSESEKRPKHGVY